MKLSNLHSDLHENRYRARHYKTPDYGKWGEPGSPIPGSPFVRAYCGACGEPIRVRYSDFKERGADDFDCDTCVSALHVGGGTHNYYRDPDADGAWGNIITALDG